MPNSWRGSVAAVTPLGTRKSPQKPRGTSNESPPRNPPLYHDVKFGRSTRDPFRRPRGFRVLWVIAVAHGNANCVSADGGREALRSARGAHCWSSRFALGQTFQNWLCPPWCVTVGLHHAAVRGTQDELARRPQWRGAVPQGPSPPASRAPVLHLSARCRGPSDLEIPWACLVSKDSTALRRSMGRPATHGFGP